MDHDWPQWRGPERNNLSRETGLLKRWPEKGPPLAWVFRNAGLGYSGPAVVGGRLFLMGARDGHEHLFALDVDGGEPKELWSARLGPMFTWTDGRNRWNRGPSATPSVDGGRVYGLGAQGDFVCADAATGGVMWRKNLFTDFDGDIQVTNNCPEKIGWGHAASPLVEGDLLILAPGGAKGTLAALDKSTGGLRWRSRDFTDGMTYSSPIVIDVEGVRQVAQVTNPGVAGVAAKDGALLWYHRREPEYKPEVIPTPVARGSSVYYTLGDFGCERLDITKAGDRFQVARAWGNKEMNAYVGDVLAHRDHVFGFGRGKGWVCQNLADGKTAWSERNAFEPGSPVYADGRLVLYGETRGGVALIEASTEKWTQHGMFQLPEASANRLRDGQRWTRPVIAGGRLYLRDQELLFCFDVREKK